MMQANKLRRRLIKPATPGSLLFRDVYASPSTWAVLELALELHGGKKRGGLPQPVGH